MTGKVIVVTGGNAGIGLGFARGIARAGGDVVIWGRRREKNEEAARELRQFAKRVFAQEVDVSDESRVVCAMREAVKQMGRVDGAIANAGIMTHARSFLELTSEKYHAINQHGECRGGGASHGADPCRRHERWTHAHPDRREGVGSDPTACRITGRIH
jgi:NAD(P)-dependent dehydrogenase (short-subunit alcohol dehydrogenase family)